MIFLNLTYLFSIHLEQTVYDTVSILKPQFSVRMNVARQQYAHLFNKVEKVDLSPC